MTSLYRAVGCLFFTILVGFQNCGQGMQTFDGAEEEEQFSFGSGDIGDRGECVERNTGDGALNQRDGKNARIDRENVSNMEVNFGKGTRLSAARFTPAPQMPLKEIIANRNSQRIRRVLSIV